MKTGTGVIRRQALRDEIYDVLLEWLLTGEFQPGESLAIDQLARHLSVSPTPVREAMIDLEHTGLVTRAALRGYRVAAPLSTEQFIQMMEVRTLLETVAAVKAFDRRAEFINELRHAHQEHILMGEQIAHREQQGGPWGPALIRDYAAVDCRVHNVVVSHCGNPYLATSVGSLSFAIFRMRQGMTNGLSDHRAAVGEHAAILRAFEGDDPRVARDAVAYHLEQVVARVRAES